MSRPTRLPFNIGYQGARLGPGSHNCPFSRGSEDIILGESVSICVDYLNVEKVLC